MNRLTKIVAAVLMVLAVLLAATAWWLGHKPAVSASTAAAPVETPTYMAVAATRKLEKGQAIAMEDVKLIAIPMQMQGTYQDVAGVVGRLPMNDIDADALITETNLVHGLALKLTEGERAIAIPVDETIGVGNKVEAGDYVDVFFTLKQGSDIDRSQARLLASRLRVLAYGSSIVGELPAKSTLPTQPSPATQARTAVLAAGIDQINPLLLAMQNGKLTLALRHPGDAGAADAALFPQPGNVLTPKGNHGALTADNRAFSGVDLSSWSGSNAARNTVSAPRSTNDTAPTSGTLEVIRGGQRERVNF